MQSDWAKESIENKSNRRSLSHLSSSLAFIFSHSFLLRTAPHYLNAWDRLSLLSLTQKINKKINMNLVQSHLIQLSGSFLQSILQRNLSQAIHPTAS